MRDKRESLQMRAVPELRALVSHFADVEELSLSDACVVIVARYFKRPDLEKASKGKIGRPKVEHSKAGDFNDQV